RPWTSLPRRAVGGLQSGQPAARRGSPYRDGAQHGRHAPRHSNRGVPERRLFGRRGHRRVAPDDPHLARVRLRGGRPVHVLDGAGQTSERDEFLYHEMLVHVPLAAHPEPRRVLVIGGGDGGTLRRVLDHPTVAEAVMVEIDERVTAVCREHLPTIAGEAWD